MVVWIFLFARVGFEAWKYSHNLLVFVSNQLFYSNIYMHTEATS